MKISIIGAYGFTGKLICAELEKNNFSYNIAGRSEEKLLQLKEQFSSVNNIFPCDLRVLTTTSDIIKNSDIIINCAGPFTEESSDFVAEITAQGKTYLDLSGEVGFLKTSRANNHDVALKSGALILHGVAFESMLADLALAIMKASNAVKVYYQFNQKRVSPGTRITMKLAKFRDSWKIDNGEWVVQNLADAFHKTTLLDKEFAAVPYPLPEIAFASWNEHAKSINTFLLLEKEEAKYVSQESRPASELMATLERLRIRKKDGPSAEDRATHKCQLFIQTDHQHWVLRCDDMYQTTALCVRLMLQKLNNGATHQGVISPAQLFKGEELEALKSLNVSLEDLSI